VRVLVVENDPAISGFVVRGLREERYVVDLADDAVAAERMAAAAIRRRAPGGRLVAQVGVQHLLGCYSYGSRITSDD
jgi:hypothetical protein